MFKDATSQEIDDALQTAWIAFHEYRKLPLADRSSFMKAIGEGLKEKEGELVPVAMRETNLPEARLKGELARTILQLNQYGTAAERGEWLEVRIDTGDSSKTPPKPDIRKMLVPLGPVVVFGASNFPFAYSTAGGDTACAFAAGCPVIVKAHPAHAATSELVAKVIFQAVEKCGLPNGVFAHLHGASVEVGKALVMHVHTKAVGFTGSYAGGKQLFDWGNQRAVPIPVFSEMGSVNPVFLMPEKLKEAAAEMAQSYAGSITLGVGQFCTNPGLIIGVEGEPLQQFIRALAEHITRAAPARMLHPGIARAFDEKRERALQQEEVEVVAISETPKLDMEGMPTVATVTGKRFLDNPVLHQEVFGPYSLVIRCRDAAEMVQVARRLEGQLTSTIMATRQDIVSNEELVEAVKDICGRLIMNGVPTGVEVCLSMQHGGPFPATTDSRFTSVGADGIKRFARPVAFQNWEERLLPDALKNDNPLHIWRTVNNQLTRDQIP